MTFRQSDVDESPRDILVIDRAATSLAQTTVRNCGGDDTRAALVALVGRGWKAVPSGGAAELLLGHSARRPELVAAVRDERPAIVAVREAVITWPGWDPDLQSTGYLPCQFTGSWRLYVREDLGSTIGPLISPPLRPGEVDQLGGSSHAELVEQIVRWRTAAVSRWAEQNEHRGGADGPQVLRLRAELEAAHRELTAIRATLSWRVTAPLRAVQRFRLGRTAR